MSSNSDDEKRAMPITPAPEYDVAEALKAVKAGRANEVDIAALILSENIDAVGNEEWTKEEDRRLMRKVDWHLIPIVSFSTSKPDKDLVTDLFPVIRLCNLVWARQICYLYCCHLQPEKGHAPHRPAVFVVRFRPLFWRSRFHGSCGLLLAKIASSEVFCLQCSLLGHC